MFNEFLEQSQICNNRFPSIFLTSGFSTVQSCSPIKTDIAKCHKNSSHLFTCIFYESWHWINSGCGWLAQDAAILNATYCTFISNNAENDGGAIGALVGHDIQGLRVLENRIHFWVVTQFCTKSPMNCCSFSNGPSLHCFSIATFGL